MALIYMVAMLYYLMVFPSAFATTDVLNQYGPCPNMCSNRGRCGSRYGLCECFDGYTGPDCSERSCAYGPAWTDIASDNDVAHKPAECSNRGICKRSTGLCSCQDGFEGVACERKSCPSNGCNQKGRCVSSKFLATMQDPGEIIKSSGCTSVKICSDGLCTEQNYSTCRTLFDNTLLWEADMMHGCICDEGYTGYDCSERVCPKGDDPLTTGQVNEIQLLECKATGGTFTLSFLGETTSNISSTATLNEFTSILSALKSLQSTGEDTKFSVSWNSSVDEVCSSSGNDIQVEFLQVFGDLALLVPDGTHLTHSETYPLLTNVKLIGGSKEYDPCSNRGTCDLSTGTCDCIDNWMTSDGNNNPGIRGDCGYNSGETTMSCPGNGLTCLGLGTCSGHPSYRCNCQVGRHGPDCALLNCPLGKSWFSFPTPSSGVSHSLTQCSGMGICDSNTGQCKCETGFHGAACEYMNCPGNPECNGHGQCLSMENLAQYATVNGDSSPFTYGTDPNNETTWDYDQMFGCLCSDGFEGYDCSLRSCPTGDDPLTPHQNNEIQQLACADSDSVGSFVLTFRGHSTSILYGTDTIEDLESALNQLPSIGEVKVEYGDSNIYLGAPGLANDALNICRPTNQTLTIEFLSPTGDVPLLGLSSINNIDGTIILSEVTRGTKENKVCSGRGICDTSSGLCKCMVGFGSSDGQGKPGSLGDCGYQSPAAPLQ